MKTLKQQIIDHPKILRRDGNSNGALVRKGSKFLQTLIYKEIMNSTIFLPSASNFSERIYCVLNDITTRVTCKQCNTALKYYPPASGNYKTYCSVRCSLLNSEQQASKKQKYKEKHGVTHHTQLESFQQEQKARNIEKWGVDHQLKVPEIKQKSKDTCMEKYGVEYSFQSDNNKLKSKETSLAKYGVKHYTNRKQAEETTLLNWGVTNPLASPEIRAKIKQSIQKKYNVDNPMQSPEVQNKAKKTNNIKYNADYYMQTPEFREKSKRYNIENYNVDYYMETAEFREKSIDTCLEKYGVKYSMQSDNVKQKVKDTNLIKYGVDFYQQCHYSDNTRNILFNKDKFEEFVKDKSRTQIAHELYIDHTTVSNYIQKYNCEDLVISISSYPEQLIANYVKETYNTTIIQNSRKIIKPLELDIYLPEHNLAIEFNGIYYHSPDKYGGKDQWLEYHYNKINRCKEQGIALLHIWEDYGDHNELIKEAFNGQINNNLEQVFSDLGY